MQHLARRSRSLLAVVLVGVAVAASGAPPTFASHAHLASPTIPSWLIGGIVAAAAVASMVALVVFLASLRRGRSPEERSRRAQAFPVRPRDAFAVVSTLVAATGLLVGALMILRGGTSPVLSGGLDTGAGGSTAATRPGSSGPWALVAIAAGGLLLIGVALSLLRRRRRSRTTTPTRLLGARRAAPATGVGSVVWEQDPRVAVLQAYAVAEQALAGEGLARGRSETPREFLARADAEEVRAPAASLTALYEQARFGQHPVHPVMRAAAIRAAERVRARSRP